MLVLVGSVLVLVVKQQHCRVDVDDVDDVDDDDDDDDDGKVDVRVEVSEGKAEPIFPIPTPSDRRHRR